MRLLAFFLFLMIFISLQSLAFDQNHSLWTEVLEKYQDKKLFVNYKLLKFDCTRDSSHTFNKYLSELQKVNEVEFNKWIKNEKMAFLINAYNAFTVKLILDNYPIKSIKKIGGWFKQPWKIEFFSLFNGKIKSLDPIEHNWLRPVFKDYRIHAAVNCASISCPSLRHEAYTGARLDHQLNEQMKDWMKDSTRNQMNYKDKLFKISKIFDWYKKDFEQWGGGVLKVISSYSPQSDLPNSLNLFEHVKIEYLDYNWDLNEAR